MKNSNIVEQLIVTIRRRDDQFTKRAAPCLSLIEVDTPSAVEIGKFIVANIEDEQDKCEALAISLASASDAGFEVINSLLSSSNRHVSTVAVKAIARSGNPQAVELIVNALRETGDDDAFEDCAKKEIVALGSEAVFALVICLNDEANVRHLRIFAADILGQIGIRVPEVTSSLLGLLRKELDIQLIVALGRIAAIGDKSAVDYLLFILNEVELARYDKAVIRALGNLRATEALHALCSILTEDQSERLGQIARSYGSNSAPEDYKAAIDTVAVEALGNIGEPLAIETLQVVYEYSRIEGDCQDDNADIDEEQIDLYLATVVALAKVGYQEVLPLLIHGLACCSVYGVGGGRSVVEGFKYCREQAVEALIPCLNDDRPAVRVNAAEALASLADRRAVPGLVQQLSYRSDSSSDVHRMVYERQVRGTAARALGAIGDSAATEPLIALLRERLPPNEGFGLGQFIGVPGDVIPALCHLHDLRAAAVLIESVLRPDSDGYYWEVLAGLRVIVAAATPLLRNTLTDAEADRRMRAVLVLGQLGILEVQDDIVRLSRQDPDERVRDACWIASIYLRRSADVPPA